MTDSPIFVLPAELVAMVAGCLTVQDVQALSCTCRHFSFFAGSCADVWRNAYRANFPGWLYDHVAAEHVSEHHTMEEWRKMCLRTRHVIHEGRHMWRSAEVDRRGCNETELVGDPPRSVRISYTPGEGHFLCTHYEIEELVEGPVWTYAFADGARPTHAFAYLMGQAGVRLRDDREQIHMCRGIRHGKSRQRGKMERDTLSGGPVRYVLESEWEHGRMLGVSYECTRDADVGVPRVSWKGASKVDDKKTRAPLCRIQETTSYVPGESSNDEDEEYFSDGDPSEDDSEEDDSEEDESEEDESEEDESEDDESEEDESEEEEIDADYDSEPRYASKRKLHCEERSTKRMCT